MPNSNIRIIIEDKVPFVRGLLDKYATVQYLAPEDITADAMRDTDGIIIRTRTRCNEELLRRSACKIITTATIGTDHIDLDYCKSRGITVVNAPGCNAPAVAQYVFASLFRTINRPISSYTIAVIGVGHVGSIVARWSEGLGMRVLLYDPPQQRAEATRFQWSDLGTIAREADIITFHTPLTMTGEDATFHMAGEAFFTGLKRAPIIINSARGGIVDTDALVKAKDAGKVGRIIIDCWEGEPNIDMRLLSRASIATPHIAGYSSEGKIRASQVALDALSTFFMMPRVVIEQPLPPAPARYVSSKSILDSYDPTPESEALKARPLDFEILRNSYCLRHEAREGRDY